MMTTFERRQRILELLRGKASLRVTELTHLLDVSEGTIRNDLTALADSQKVKRVRGGAVLAETLQNEGSVFEARAQQQAQAKKRMAGWAADMVEDGDSIILDASTTVFYMAPFLQSRKGVTIFTNGLEVARVLAANPANTVILIGGVLRTDGSAVIGHLGEKLLEGMHIKTAFISCSGFSVAAGLTEVDLQDVPLKLEMIQRAGQVVALIDSSKFGRVGLTAFAGVDLISRIVTDHHIEESFVEEVRRTHTALTICGETTATSFAALNQQTRHHKIGFANLGEDVSFAVEVRHSLERAAKEAGNIDLIVADNQLDSKVALHVADRLLEKGVDLVIEYQIDEKIGSLLMNKFRQKNIPVIAVDIPLVGASYLGADNYRAGYMAGRALAEWISQQWQGRLDRLFVLAEPRAGALPAARMQGQLDGFQALLGEILPTRLTYLDSGNTLEISQRATAQALQSYGDDHRIGVICFNDEAALGALAAARQAGREEEVVIVGQGADRRVRPEIRRGDSPVIGSTAFMPEQYGEKLVALAQKILAGQVIPPATYIDHVFVDATNIDQFYPE